MVSAGKNYFPDLVNKTWQWQSAEKAINSGSRSAVACRRRGNAQSIECHFINACRVTRSRAQSMWPEFAQ